MKPIYWDDINDSTTMGNEFSNDETLDELDIDIEIVENNHVLAMEVVSIVIVAQTHVVIGPTKKL
jgi:hypothetical protein